ncbi:MAG: hypothetical protein JXQ27_00530 [Acidobacteria bacterium]|nr:hypothetical protein [Acidobacteriota bacterium]
MPHEILFALQRLPALAALLLICGAALKPALDRRLTSANRRNGWLLFTVFLVIFLLDMVQTGLQVGMNHFIVEWDIPFDVYLWFSAGLTAILLALFILAGVILFLFRPDRASVEGGA